jgi:hypothetical protein
LVVFLGYIDAHGMPDGSVWILAGSDEPLVAVALPEAAVDAMNVELAAAHSPDEIGFGAPPRLRDVAEPVGLELGDALHGC